MNDDELPGDRDTVPGSSSSPPETLRCRNDKFAAFYKADFPRLVGFLMYQGARPDQASEVAQETMARAFQLWESIERPKGWVRTVASREFIRRYVAEVRETPLDELTDGQWFRAGVSTDLADWERRHVLLRAVKVLPPRQRQVIAWWLDGYRPAEIANELEIPPGTVRANLSKARQALGKHLQQESDDY